MKNERDIIIRRAQLPDAAAIGALSGELGYPTTTEEMERRLRTLDSNDEHAVFVAQDEVLLGWIHVSAIESLESALFAEIRGLVVTASRRDSGIGTRLVEVAEKWANEKQCPRIRVRTNVVRVEAHLFYKKLGYTMKKSQDIFDKSLLHDE
jgi:GNAT superfamily N-acetyltransferase